MKRRAILAATALAVVAAPAMAQNRQPDWLKKPTPENLMAVWPTEAFKRGKGGKATISCAVTAQGALRNCKVASESPPGMGFGGAALALAPQFLMTPALVDGKPVESSVNIPINFDAPGTPFGSRVAYNDVQGAEQVYSNIPWQGAPTVQEVLAAYPAKAREQRVGGIVTLDCRVGTDGRLSNCNELREEPKGLGFDRAAKSLAPKFLGPTKNKDGAELGRYRTSVTFTFAPPPLEGPPTIGKPKWTALPTVEDFESALPAKAKAAGVYKARVALSCTVGARGRADGCKVVSEDPPSLGWGEAALALAPGFGLNLWTEEGLPTVGGTVRIPVRFDLSFMAEGAAPAK